jgi:hypothetical protein
MKTKRQLTLVTLVALTFLAGCKDMGVAPVPAAGTAPPPTPGGSSVSFSRNVLPILINAGCTGCHGGTANLFAESVAQLLAGGDHGPAIVPGKADSSSLVQKLLTPPLFGSRMPFGGAPLPDASITTIRKWINEGALNN